MVVIDISKFIDVYFKELGYNPNELGTFVSGATLAAGGVATTTVMTVMLVESLKYEGMACLGTGGWGCWTLLATGVAAILTGVSMMIASALAGTINGPHLDLTMLDLYDETIPLLTSNYSKNEIILGYAGVLTKQKNI